MNIKQYNNWQEEQKELEITITKEEIEKNKGKIYHALLTQKRLKENKETLNEHKLIKIIELKGKEKEKKESEKEWKKQLTENQ